MTGRERDLERNLQKELDALPDALDQLAKQLSPGDKQRLQEFKDKQKELRARIRELEKQKEQIARAEQDDEIPELTDEWFESAEIHVGGVKVGRPPLPPEKRKVPTKIRIDREVLEAFRATGEGWQTRMAEALKRAASRLGENQQPGQRQIKADKLKASVRQRGTWGSLKVKSGKQKQSSSLRSARKPASRKERA